MALKALQSTPPVVARLVSTVTVGHCFSRLLWGGDGNRASSDAAELTVFTEIHFFLEEMHFGSCCRTWANFQSSERVESDNVCQCVHTAL